MTAESYLEEKLQRFSILDIGLIELVYFSLSLLALNLYPKLSILDWWFYCIIGVICIFPLWVHLCSQSGTFFEKMNQYLKTNGPSIQVLLCLSVFFFALTLAVICPVIASCSWWVYVAAAVIFAIKPLTVSWIW